MQTQPAVSVIIPTYNRDHLVGRTIRSVLSQTLQDFELLVVDDGSSDHTEEVVCSFKDPRIRYLRHGVNRGAPASRNTGIKVARAQYLAFLDDDVQAMPEKLERQLEVIRRPGNEDVAVVLCGAARQDRTRVIEVIPRLSGWVYEQLLSHRVHCSSTSAILVNKKLFAGPTLFDESLPSHQDYDFLVGLARGGRVLMVRDPLVLTLEHGGDKISTPPRRLKGYLRLHEKYSAEFRTRPSAHSHHHVLTARGYWIAGDKEGCRRELLKAMKTCPTNLETYGWLAALGLGEKGLRGYTMLGEGCSRLLRPWSIPRGILRRVSRSRSSLLNNADYENWEA